MDQPLSQPLAADSSNFLLNNVRLTLDSQARLQNPAGPSTTMVNRLQTSCNNAMVKNVNVDNFKLGNNEAGGCSNHHEEEEEVDERLTDEQVKNINIDNLR